MKIIFFIIIGICFCLIFNQKLFSQKNKIKEIEIRYVDYFIEVFEGRFRLEEFFKNRKYSPYEKVNIGDKKTIELIGQELGYDNDTINIGSCDDFRIIILIKLESNHNDTLAFGDCCVSSINNRLIKPNLNILKAIIPYFKKEYQDDYYYYVHEIEKLYNCP